MRHRISFDSMFNGSEEESEIESLIECSECMGSGAKSKEGVAVGELEVLGVGFGG